MCSFGLKENQRRNAKDFDVPHHVTEIIMIIMPRCEPEHRCRRGGGGVCRRHQVEKCGVAIACHCFSAPTKRIRLFHSSAQQAWLFLLTESKPMSATMAIRRPPGSRVDCGMRWGPRLTNCRTLYWRPREPATHIRFESFHHPTVAVEVSRHVQLTRLRRRRRRSNSARAFPKQGSVA